MIMIINTNIVFFFFFCLQYACRKTLADRRVRVRGRFARNNELMMCGDQQMESQKINNIDPAFKDIELCCDDTVQVLYNFI